MLALIGNTLFFVSFFFLCGLDTDYFAAAYLWTLVGALTLDSIVGFVAAVSKDMESALALAPMLLGVFCLFGGVVRSKLAGECCCQPTKLKKLYFAGRDEAHMRIVDEMVFHNLTFVLLHGEHYGRRFSRRA